jgi:hypothetical protein
VIRRHPNTQMSLMRTRRTSIACALLTADVKIKSTSYRSPNGGAHGLKNGIPETCRGTLALYKVPTLAFFVRSLAVAVFGKLVRI